MSKRFRAIGITCAALVMAIAGMAARAEAVPITGSLAFSGGIAPGTDYLTTNSITVLGAQLNCAAPGLCTGSYAALNGENPAITYNSFTFAPLPAGGYNPLWSFAFLGTLYQFNLTNITQITRSAGGVLIHGFGLAQIGSESTMAQWSFGSNATGAFSFSSTMTATPTTHMPEPGSMILLGSGLFGLAAAARKRMRKTSH